MAVVGSGAAGISVALTAAAAGLRVVVVTKDLVGGATPMAQGGLAAALGAGDTPGAHASDTLVAGAGLCAPDVVAALADGAPGAIGWLAGLGARLETRDLRLEGGHSAHRIVHSGDDATGAEVHRTLLAALLASGIEILDRTVALDLLLSGTDGFRRTAGSHGTDGTVRTIEPGGTDGAGTGAGARAVTGTAAANAGPAGPLAGEPVPVLPGVGHAAVGGPGVGGPGVGDAAVGGPGVGEAAVGGPVGGGTVGGAVTGLAAAFIGAGGRLTPGVIAARAVVIAAGGLGQAFGTTSNPPGATGDGIAIAARAGAVIRDLEFVQFHPTVLWLPGASGQCPLITEALRGAGAVLRDPGGAPLMAGHDPRGDLAPRDVVAARMTEVIGQGTGDAGHVWLDATFLGREVLENGFPTVTAACRKHGIDPVTEMIPVAPGAHYSCGGILADLDGRTSLEGLYAAGEAASTGVQGANRLASNSVTEAIIAGRRTGAAVAASLAATRASARSVDDWAAAGRPGVGAGRPGVGAGRPGVGAPTAAAAAAAAPAPAAAAAAAAPALAPAAAAAAAAAAAPAAAAAAAAPAPAAAAVAERDGDAGEVDTGETGVAGGRAALAQAMSRHAGVIRDGDGLTQLLTVIAEASGAPCSLASAMPGGLDLESVEAANLRAVSVLIAVGARRRAESRGCHRRRDAADTASAPWHTLIRWDGHKLVVTKEAL